MPQANWIWKVGLVLAHTLPVVGLLINFYLTDSVIELKDWWHSLVLAVAYCIVNYIFCETNGEPVYPFLTWEDPFSAFYCLLCWGFGASCCAIAGII